MRKLFIIIGILLTPLWLYLSYFIVMSVLGYEFTHSADLLAQKIAEENRPAEDCFLFRTMDIGPGPTTFEMQMSCVYELADIKSDPTICELILPFKYAMSCIGAAENFSHGECYLYLDGKLMCAIPGPDNIFSSYTFDQIDNCEAYAKYNNRQVIFWCYAERAEQFGELERCLDYATSNNERDYCYYQRATMLEDLQIEQCDFIQQQPMKLGCQTTIRAWEKYPQLRPPVD